VIAEDVILPPQPPIPVDPIVLPPQPPIVVAGIPAPSDLTPLGITNWNRDKRLIPDWRDFPKQGKKCQGLKNLVKMLNSAVGYMPPNTTTNECNNCGVILHWINDCGITLQNGKFYYSVRCNGICLKDNVSIPVKVLVDSGERCHNPRCSNVPTLSWLKNKRSYCSLDCIDGYQEWNDEASIEVSLLYSLHTSLTQFLKGRVRFLYFL
jgi:hypothetical protein